MRVDDIAIGFSYLVNSLDVEVRPKHPNSFSKSQQESSLYLTEAHSPLIFTATVNEISICFYTRSIICQTFKQYVEEMYSDWKIVYLYHLAALMAANFQNFISR